MAAFDDLFAPRRWADRVSEFPIRRRLADPETGEEWVVDVAREEGAVHTEGDWLDADALNGLEARLEAAFTGAGDALNAHEQALAAQAAGLDGAAGALSAHAAEANPHGVTPALIGAAKAGDLAAHMENGGNPHGVTPALIGAAGAGELSAHMEDGANPHGVSREQLGAAGEQDLFLYRLQTDGALQALGETLESETARLQALIETNPGGNPEVWVNAAPGNAKFYAGAPVGHVYRVLNHNVTYAAKNDLADSGWPGYLAVNGSNNFSFGVPLAVTHLSAGDAFELEFAGTGTTNENKTASLYLSDDEGNALGNKATFTINGTPTRQTAVLSVDEDTGDKALYLAYVSTEGLGYRGDQRIYTLKLMHQELIGPEGPPLGANLYDPMGVGDDAFDAANHRLVGYQTGTAGPVAGGDTVLEAIAKLEARIVALGG